MPRTEITRDDTLPMERYLAIRREKRAEMAELKRNRRVAVGPHATFYFESWDTMWYQVHEMLAIERGGEEQIDDELDAYNPLIPNGAELVATVMFEIDNPVQRKAVLGKLGGVEETMYLEIAGQRVMARPEEDVDRTTADGKASSVQFVHFGLTPEQVARFREPGTEVVIGVAHPEYGHMARIPEEVRAALAGDLAG